MPRIWLRIGCGLARLWRVYREIRHNKINELYHAFYSPEPKVPGSIPGSPSIPHQVSSVPSKIRKRSLMPLVFIMEAWGNAGPWTRGTLHAMNPTGWKMEHRCIELSTSVVMVSGGLKSWLGFADRDAKQLRPKHGGGFLCTGNPLLGFCAW
ncbi:MAG: hypothetical protein JG766_665 [Desulfacinum sp.]|jgi:hypothetical protein|nr:hypothetical protein [Desulfacinum sp.]